MANSGDPTDRRVPASTAVTSLSLLQRARSHDQTAWNELVHLYYPLVYRWCRTAGLQEQDTLDVVQEVFRGVAGGLAGFRKQRPGDSFRGWLRGITRHKLQDFWRQRQLQQLASGGTTAQQRLAAIPELTDQQQRQELGEVARRALELVRLEFEDTTWQAAWQILVADEKVKDVATDLGMTPNAVYKAKARVMRRVRDKLEDLIEGE